MDALQFFLLHHKQTHWQVERDFLTGLSDEQMRCRPYERSNSIAWLVWHMARCEDMMGLTIAGRPQVLDEGDWLKRLHLSIRDVGTGMADEEVSDFSARVDIAALRAYYETVGRRTVEVVKSLRPEDLDEVPNLQKLRAEGVFRENAMWAISEREGKRTNGQWLGHLGIAHNQTHRGEALTIRGLLGIRNR
jgi:uncharacterized damage-inducible protein DinB